MIFKKMFSLGRVKNLVCKRKLSLLMISNIVFGVCWLSNSYEILFIPHESGVLASDAIPISYYHLDLAIIFIFSSVFVWFGNHAAKLILLLSLAYISASAMEESVLAINFYMHEHLTISHLLKNIGNLWWPSVGLRWLLWLVFNYWYLMKNSEK